MELGAGKLYDGPTGRVQGLIGRLGRQRLRTNDSLDTRVEFDDGVERGYRVVPEDRPEIVDGSDPVDEAVPVVMVERDDWVMDPLLEASRTGS